MSTENLYKCPACGKVIDYKDSEPTDGRTYCSTKGKTVRMVKVPNIQSKKEKEE